VSESGGVWCDSSYFLIGGIWSFLRRRGAGEVRVPVRFLRSLEWCQGGVLCREGCLIFFSVRRGGGSVFFFSGVSEQAS